MEKFLAVLTLSGLFLLGCVEVNGAEDETPKAGTDSNVAGDIQLPVGFTEYEPTGDALWDRYAQALLEQLAWQVLDYVNQPVSVFKSVLPQETILEWEDDFGDDPRYWQLCYVNADRLEPNELGTEAKIKGYTYSGPDPMTYLEQAVEQDVMDKATVFLLAYARLIRIDEFSPANQEEQIFNWLVEQCPEESEAYYRRAEYWMELGEWDKGLADLEAGNAATNNRILMPFPFSFVMDAARNETPVGNNVVAGAVSGDLMFPYVLGNAIQVKRNLRSQFVRLDQGHSTKELAPWVTFSCRYGSVENGSYLRRIAGPMFLGMIAEYSLVVNGDTLSRDQRAAVLLLAKKATRIGAYLHYDQMLGGMGPESFLSKIDKLTEEYGFSQTDIASGEIDQDDPVMQIFGLATSQLYFEQPWVELQREQTFLYAELVKEFRKILHFDPVAIEWEPRLRNLFLERNSG